MICPLDFMTPSQSSGRGSAEGGTTSATGSPNRVMRTGFRVRRTRSRTARQVALNFEIAIFSIWKNLPAFAQATIVKDHGQSISRPGVTRRLRENGLIGPSRRIGQLCGNRIQVRRAQEKSPDQRLVRAFGNFVWLRGPDLNQRPLDCEGNSSREASQSDPDADIGGALYHPGLLDHLASPDEDGRGDRQAQRLQLLGSTTDRKTETPRAGASIPSFPISFPIAYGRPATAETGSMAVWGAVKNSPTPAPRPSSHASTVAGCVPGPGASETLSKPAGPCATSAGQIKALTIRGRRRSAPAPAYRSFPE